MYLCEFLNSLFKLLYAWTDFDEWGVIRIISLQHKYITEKKNIPDTASRSPTTRSSSSTRYRTVLCTTSTKSEPNRVVRGESARPARERRARTRSTPPKRLKQNETVKKTPLAYIDVTVTWRRITDSNRHRNRATLALNSVAKSSVSHHCFVVIVRSNFQ